MGHLDWAIPAQQSAEETLGFRSFVRSTSYVFRLWELQSKQKANLGTDMSCPSKSKVSAKTTEGTKPKQATGKY